MKTSEYYLGLRKLQAALDEQFTEGYCTLCSVTNLEKNTLAGSVVEASNENAARCIAEGTHRIAAPDEVDAWRQHQELNRQESQSKEFVLRGQRVIWGGGR
jgi:hypothetical protein